MKNKTYKYEAENGLAIAYGMATVAYIALIGYLMINRNELWFLALYLWNWRWSK